MGKALIRFINKITKENLWIYVVNTLLQGPKTGYEIVKEIRDRYMINVTTVAVYVVLYKMERDGLLVSYDDNGKRRYRVTQDGLREYNEAIKALVNLLSRFNCTLKCGSESLRENP